MYQIKKILNQYFADCNAKVLSPKTIECYRIELKHLQDFETPEDLRNQIIDRVFNDDHIAHNTKCLKSYIYKAFMNWLNYNYGMKLDTKMFKRLQQQQTRQAYTDEELEILFYCLDKYNNLKLTLYFKLLLLSGLRASEVNTLDLNKLVNNNFIIQTSTAKNNNDRTIIILDDYSKCSFNKYVQNFKEELTEHYPIMKWTDKTLKNNFTIFKKFVHALFPDFKKDISVHMLRHTYFTYLYINGASPEFISGISGHKSTATLMNTYIKQNVRFQTEKLDDIMNDKTRAKDNKAMEQIIKNSVYEAVKNVLLDQNPNDPNLLQNEQKMLKINKILNNFEKFWLKLSKNH